MRSTANSGLNVGQLLSNTAYPHAVTGIALRKPVHFDFVDASTLERRPGRTGHVERPARG